MPLVHVHLRAGRTPAQKRAILDGLHSAFVEALTIPEADRNQLLHEHAPEHFEGRCGPETILVENWGIRGGQAACDVQLGFKIDV